MFCFCPFNQMISYYILNDTVSIKQTKLQKFAAN